MTNMMMWHVQVPRRMIGTDAFQETPIVEVTRQITKHNYLVMDIRDLPRVVKEVCAADRCTSIFWIVDLDRPEGVNLDRTEDALVSL